MRKMKLSRQFTVFGSAIFCVVIFSLYLMLDRGHLDYPSSPRREGSYPQAQLSVLQEKIDHLERLLAENNEIISNIRDSVINLSESVDDDSKDSQGNFSQGAGSQLQQSELYIQVDPSDCLSLSQTGSLQPDVQMLDVYNLIPFDNPDGGVWKQGFDIKYEDHEWDDESLQVFVVPHSHNDPGWLKTFNEYFREKTHYIFNNMVIKLKEDSSRKFMWSEISYLSKWWDIVDTQKKEAVKRFLQTGQFEVVTGGWVMPDEATSHYFALIDQLIEGHQWLEKHLGVKPRSGWAIDPFGHSPTMAYLLKRAGFSHMLIQRVHYAVKKHFAQHKTLEFFWRQNWDLGSATDIFCHMMPFYSYDIPHTCGPDPKICCQFDFKRLPGGSYDCPWGRPSEEISSENVQRRALLILDQYRKKSKLFRTKVLLAPLGDDFRYTDYSEWDLQFKNYEYLFKYMNSQPQLGVKIQFGTLSDYFDAVDKADKAMKKKGQSMFPVLSGDFFTYADRDDHYWSGYFTSRPFYKRMDRIVESHLRAAEIIYYFAQTQAQKFKINKFLLSTYYTAMTEARRNLGLFQHHDAITGTAKDWVVVDYGTRLFHSLLALEKIIGDSAFLLILKNKPMFESYSSDPLLEMSSIQKSQDSLPQNHVIKPSIQEPRYLVIYNPLEQHRDSVVSTYVNNPNVQVLTDTGKLLDIQVSAVWIKEDTISQEVYKELTPSTERPSSGSRNFPGPGLGARGNCASVRVLLRAGQDSPIAWVARQGERNAAIRIGYQHGRDLMSAESGGGEIFINTSGDISSWSPGIEGRSVEISNIVNIRNVYNREIAMRISSEINSQNRFYTDLNGYQIQPRMTLSKLPLQANVYPMTTMAYIQDAKNRLTLLSAQSSGVSSLKSGDIEVIMDRRLMQDDNRGLGQGVTDNKITANLFRILLEERSGVDMEEEKKSPVSFPSLLSHITSSFLNHPVFVMTAKVKVSSELLSEFSPLVSSLPCDIHLVNLRTIQAKEGKGYSSDAALILHRKGFGCQFSTSGMGLLCSTTQGKISVYKLFNTFTIEDFVPSSLSLMHTPPVAQNISVIYLSPMEISTFRIRLR
ncbi:Hypothetical predicted protein [Marmota monax]|uniref:Alpha-mannosidase n=1 Tax=Marmota monax TaxID=9995 RepID=A0A5E4B5F7_MARMO|nr:Hypothetical predicted protein [Marmota monax]